MSTQGEYLTAIADAIREKEGSTDAIVASDFASRISAIASDTTATASDILSGKTAYTADGEVTGTIATVSAATPSISVSSAGVITATTSQSAGYIASDASTSATKSLTTQAAKTVTPSTSSQTAVASGQYTTGAVTVAGDSNLTAANIASGVSIFGVTGTYTSFSNMTTVTKTGLDTTTFSVTGLSFTPTGILIMHDESSLPEDYTESRVVDSVFEIGTYTASRGWQTNRVNLIETYATATFGTSSVSVVVVAADGSTRSYYYEGDYFAYIW